MSPATDPPVPTAELIARLAADTRPARAHAPAWRIAGALLGGGALGMLMLALAWNEAPFGMLPVTGAFGLGVKQFYALSMAVVAAGLALRAGRPGRRVGAAVAWLLVPFLAVAVLATKEQMGAPAGGHAGLMMGGTWKTCLATAVALGGPVFAALLWAFRRLAPTRPGEAGFFAGFAAGATGCAVYALFCPETAASFLIAWYTLAMLVSGLLGAALGGRWLRW